MEKQKSQKHEPKDHDPRELIMVSMFYNITRGTENYRDWINVPCTKEFIKTVKNHGYQHDSDYFKASRKKMMQNHTDHGYQKGDEIQILRTEPDIFGLSKTIPPECVTCRHPSRDVVVPCKEWCINVERRAAVEAELSNSGYIASEVKTRGDGRLESITYEPASTPDSQCVPVGEGSVTSPFSSDGCNIPDEPAITLTKTQICDIFHTLYSRDKEANPQNYDDGMVKAAAEDITGRFIGVGEAKGHIK
jgi:hypothetical protein